MQVLRIRHFEVKRYVIREVSFREIANEILFVLFVLILHMQLQDAEAQTVRYFSRIHK